MAVDIINAENVGRHFILGGQKIEVLKDVSLRVRRGEFVVVSGSSGSGKTTLLSLLSGLDKPDSGHIELCSREITPLSEDQLAPMRNGLIGFIFQSFHLIPSLTALENVRFPADLKKDPQAHDKATALLEKVGIGHRADNYPSQMSGGEQQRVAICRALINEPEIVFADEPTGNLDLGNSEGIIDLLFSIHDELNTTFVIATHSHSLASRAGRVIRLRGGRVEEDGGAR